MVNFPLPHHARGGVPVVDAELAAGAVAVGVHRRLGHAELARDLLGAQMLVDQPQAFALPLREQVQRLGDGVGPSRHASAQ